MSSSGSSDASDPSTMSREEVLESLRAAEMQRDMVDDLIRKQQDLIKLMEQKMDKLSAVAPSAPTEEAAGESASQTQDKAET